jgi:putative hydrolase of the HAD superfamily
LKTAGRVNTILFDLGRVLIDFDHMASARAIAGLTTRPPKEIYDLFFDSPLTRSFEEGKIPAREFFFEVKALLKLDITFERFAAIWNDIFFISTHNREALRLATSLRKRYRVCMLSNINTLHLEYCRTHFAPVFKPFHLVFASCELGFIKPEPEIYRKALALLKAEPEEVFYTDDRKELVEVARGMGFKAYVFNGAGQLKLDLARAGVSY